MQIKRIPLLLVLLICVCLLPVTVFAAEDATSGTCGENLTWTLDDAGTLTISGTGAMKDYDSSVDAPWTSMRGSVSNVVIESGVTGIGEWAFSYCNNLTSIEISSSVTSIGKWAFFDCSSLTSIEIPSSVTSIGEIAFSYCESLTSITVESGNPVYHSAGNCVIETASKTLILGYKNSVIPADGSVTSIGECAFFGCRSMTSIEIPSNVTSIGESAFQNCSNLTSIEIPSSVTSIGGSAFYFCSSLTSIEIPSNVTSIGYGIFSNCNNLTNITVESGNPVYHSAGNCLIETESGTLIMGCNSSVIPADGSVTSIGIDAFSCCTGLTSIEIPSCVTSIGGGAFQNCSKLTSIAISSNITSIGDHAFFACDSLTSITFDGVPPATIDGAAFIGVTATAYYPAGNPAWTEDVMQGYGGDITWVAKDMTGNTPKPTEPEPTEPTPAGATPMYRLYNQYTNEHLFLTDAAERTSLISAGWTDEGIGWTAATDGDSVYRLYNPYGNFHFYTKDTSEANYLTTLGWTIDGIVTYDAGPAGVPIYRLFNPYEQTNYHHYTTGMDEVTFLVSLGWRLEGIAWHAAE